MTPLISRLQDELQKLSGTTPAAPVQLDSDELSLHLDLETVESLSASVNRLQLDVPALYHASVEKLESIAQTISREITYLLEQVGPIEIDRQSQKVLIRSTPPTAADNGGEFYEVLLQTAPGTLSIQRFAWSADQSVRRPVPLLLTQQVLVRLVGDLERIVTEAS